MTANDETLKPRRIGAIAWVALGLGVLTCAWVFWSESPASSSFYLAVFGPANDGEILVLLPIYAVAALFEIATLLLVKGWRSRAVVVAGVIAVLLPIPLGIWAPM